MSNLAEYQASYGTAAVQDDWTAIRLLVALVADGYSD
ncbi:hypothetical protein OKW11_004938 [Pseudomonas baetica]|nr:hypothetical protein [Pseudomonas baetica]